MQIHQIVLEQEEITSAQQMRQAFTADEWQKIECAITKNYLESLPQGFTSASEMGTRRLFQRVHAQVGGNMPARYTPSEWNIYATSLRVPLNVSSPSWKDIKDFLATLITNDPLIPGCDYDSSAPSGATANPDTPESKADILSLMSDGPDSFETMAQLSEYMRTFLTRLGQTESRRDQDSRMLTWLDRISVNNGNNTIMQYYANIASSFATQNSNGQWELTNSVSKRDVDNRLWEWLLIADRAVNRARSRDATASE